MPRELRRAVRGVMLLVERFVMYAHHPEPSWSTRLFGSARTLAAIVLTALLASALTVRWSDASATGVTVFTPETGAAVAAMPVTVEGKLIGASDGLVALVEHGADSPVAFSVSQEAQLVRGEERVPLEALRTGDTVRMTIDGRSGSVLRLHASPSFRSGLLACGAGARCGRVHGGARVDRRGYSPHYPQHGALAGTFVTGFGDATPSRSGTLASLLNNPPVGGTYPPSLPPYPPGGPGNCQGLQVWGGKPQGVQSSVNVRGVRRHWS